ncbi:MAG TPA: hypothetical protein VMG08_16150 [Allosphingosinicella sp.]|nr:hypothetical protein [Allosphingosinicella sp.]
MGTAFPIRLGGRIASETGARLGRIGAFATDRAGRLFALGARHVIEAETSEIIYADGLPLGARFAFGPRQDEDGSFPRMSDAIGAIRLDDSQSTVITEACGFLVEGCIDDAMPLIGDTAFCISSAMSPIRCTVTGVDLSVFVRGLPHETPRRLWGAIEITFEAEDNPTLGKGDAGAPVVDARGNIIGLAISATGRRCYVALLAEYLRDNGLVAKFGAAKPTSSYVSEPSMAYIHATFRAVGEGLSQWANDMRRQVRDAGQNTLREDEPAEA